MKESAPKYTTAQLEQLADRVFIEWMVEDLDSTQLLFILNGLEIEIRRIKGKNLPKLFLKNKLLIKTTRTKFRDTDLYPPLPWLLEIEGKLSKEKVMEATMDSAIPIREKALSFFMQNHYDEAYKLFENRNSKASEEKATADKDISEETAVEPKTALPESKGPTKLEKRLTQKITNLENERGQLQMQLKELQIEMKEKIALKQKEINRLNGVVAAEKNEKETILMESEQEKEQLIREVDFLKIENDQLKLGDKSKKAPVQQKKKIALLGNPKNQRILKNSSCEIEVFDAGNFPLVIEKAEEFSTIYLLTWRFSMDQFEKEATRKIIEKTTFIASFPELEEKLEESSHVN